MKKLKLNNKGFTLVELIAVIVILAVIILIATNAVGNSMSNARKMALATEANTLIKGAEKAFQYDSVISTTGVVSTNKTCYSLDYLYKQGHFSKPQANNGYDGSVLITPNAAGTSYTYTVWITNNAYSIVSKSGEASASDVVSGRTATLQFCGGTGYGTSSSNPTTYNKVTGSTGSTADGIGAWYPPKL